MEQSKQLKLKPTIIKKSKAITVEKANKTSVDYFLFDTFEIHQNIVPSGCVQDWHQHTKIEEIILIHSGSLQLEWLENGYHKKEVNTGEIIRMNKSIHRISNIGQAEVTFTVFRFVATNENQSTIIKTDKKIYSEEEIDIRKEQP